MTCSCSMTGNCFGLSACVLSRSLLSNSLQPYWPSPAWFHCPWDFPGKKTGVGCPCPSPGELPHPGIKPKSLMFLALAYGFFTTSATSDTFNLISESEFLMKKVKKNSLTPSPSHQNDISSVQLLSRVWLFATPWIAARQASLSITNSQSSPKAMSTELVMPSNHLILCHPLLLLLLILPSIRVFSNESTCHMRCTKY